MSGLRASRRALPVAALVIVLSGCGKSRLDGGPQPATTRAAVWGNLRLQIPVDAHTSEEPERLNVVLRPGARTPQVLTLQRSSPEEHAALERAARSKAALPAGRLVYRIDAFEGGSGGAEATLVGAIEVGGATYRVECQAQSESPAPDGEWCLPYVRTIERR